MKLLAWPLAAAAIAIGTTLRADDIRPSSGKSDELPRRGTLGLAFSPVPPSQREAHGLKDGQGAVVVKATPGATGEKAGLKAGDLLLSLDGKAVELAKLAVAVRELPAGKPLKLQAIRDGKPLELVAAMVEKPRDPGTADYAVDYRHIVSHGKRMRTIVTTPKKPGRHAALMFIQGFSPVSYDYTLATAKGDAATIDGPLLHRFASRNFVTLRVEKPGVGDSEGGPFAELDYATELDIYRQALKQLKALEAVDPGNVFIFGHSMGGAFGPMVASEIPVKGIAVYGAAARTWHEYLIDTLRYQGLVAGGSFEQADETARHGSRVMALVFHENRSVEQIKKSHPELAGLADQLFPNGLFNGKTLEFWRQLGQTNFPSYWTKCGARVLAVRGASDFVTYDVDHKLIADIVNRRNPGWGKFALAPNSDHLLHDFPSESASMRSFQHGTYNPAFANMMMAWIDETMAAKG